MPQRHQRMNHDEWEARQEETITSLDFSLTEVYFLGFSYRSKSRYTETHTNREAASAVSRPGILGPLTQKQQKHYKTHGILMILNFSSTAPVGIKLLFQERVP